MDVVQQKAPLAKAGQCLFHLPAIELAPVRGALEALHDPCFIALRLQAADKPGAGVGQTLVVEVNRILGREMDPDDRQEVVDFMAQGINPDFDLDFSDEGTTNRLRAMVGLIFMSPEFLWR